MSGDGIALTSMSHPGSEDLSPEALEEIEVEINSVVLSPDELKLVLDALDGRSHQLVNMADEPHSISMDTRQEWAERAEKMRELHERLKFRHHL